MLTPPTSFRMRLSPVQRKTPGYERKQSGNSQSSSALAKPAEKLLCLSELVDMNLRAAMFDKHDRTDSV